MRETLPTVSTLFLEPFGGMAGDMLLAALLDLQDPRFTIDELRGLVQELVPGEASLELEEVRRGSLRALHLAVHTAAHAVTQGHQQELLPIVASRCVSRQHHLVLIF